MGRGGRQRWCHGGPPLVGARACARARRPAAAPPLQPQPLPAPVAHGPGGGRPCCVAGAPAAAGLVVVLVVVGDGGGGSGSGGGRGQLRLWPLLRQGAWGSVWLADASLHPSILSSIHLCNPRASPPHNPPQPPIYGGCGSVAVAFDHPSSSAATAASAVDGAAPAATATASAGATRLSRYLLEFEEQRVLGACPVYLGFVNTMDGRSSPPPLACALCASLGFCNTMADRSPLPCVCLSFQHHPERAIYR